MKETDMPVEEHPKFEEWEKALSKVKWYREAYQAAKEAFGKGSALAKHAKAKLAEADAEYDRIVSELS
jgi:hypothetical protein